MTSIAIDEDDKQYIEKLRKDAPTGKVLNIKQTAHCVLGFIKKNENEYMIYMNNQRKDL